MSNTNYFNTNTNTNINEFINTIDTVPSPSLSNNLNTTLFYPNNYSFSTLFPTSTPTNELNSFLIHTSTETIILSSSFPSTSYSNYNQAPVQMQMESSPVPTPIQITYPNPIPSPTPGPIPSQINWMGNGPQPVGWMPSWGATGTHPPGWHPSWGATGTHPPTVWNPSFGASGHTGSSNTGQHLYYGHTGTYYNKQSLITSKFIFDEKNFSIKIYYLDDDNNNDNTYPKFLRRLYHLKYDNIDIKVILKIDEHTFEPVSNKRFDKIVDILEKLSRMNLYFSNICKNILVKDIFINKKIASRFEIEI